MITLLGIILNFQGLTYFQTDQDIRVGETVVCPTEHGVFLGRVSKMRIATEEESNRADFTILFPPILRVATEQDLQFEEAAKVREKEITKYTQAQSDALNLNMKVLNSYLDVDDDKVLITFTSDARVDFRELVRILNSVFHLKIELRQIGPRDQAKLVGGIGPCGLPLCCSSFLTSFEVISLAMAKNQLLAINIPKLSGQCGKLLCCLNFEDKAYAELRPLFPKIGDKITYLNTEYEVVSLNLLTGNITTYNGENYETFTKEEYERVKKGLSKGTETNLIKDVNSNVNLSGLGVEDTKERFEQIRISEEKRKTDNRQNNNNHQNNNKSNNSNNKNKNGNNRNNNQNRQNGNTFSSTNPSNKNNHSKNRNNNYHRDNNFNKPKNNNSGFIPVDQIADKSILDYKPVSKKDNDD